MSALEPGSRIGPYEVLSPLGAGGMGEVVRARDTRLGREVAIKGLPPAFAADPERLARFDREARLLASLSHPNIAVIYGLEESGGTPFLVLELVEGESLAHRLSRGALTAPETLELAGQIAAAVEAAHGRGIIHRDLKPGNVMLTAAGVVKVLDFGLAKSSAQDSAAPRDLSASPTLAMTTTGAGIILGTAPYMSPEQARGRVVDPRADVWAFGCILFECLSGRQAFAGETVSDVIARILERDPEWGAIPAAAPARLLSLVQRCLTKDLESRPGSMADLRRELNAIRTESSSSSSRLGRPAGASPSLAVLYFENLAHDPESEYFCAGITEDILTDLSKIKGLRVSSRNAVQRFRGAPIDIPKVAAELGVGAVLEGSVRRAGERVRITAQLINAADGFQLWAERYDRTLQDVFAVQEEIASSIAAALRVALTPSDIENLVQNRPKDVRAYDLYLKGREHYSRYTAPELAEAFRLFQQATEIDPGYALAWAGMADSYGQMLQWGSEQDPADIARQGLEAVRRALEINPRLPEAFKAEALIRRFRDDYEGSRRALLKAIEVNPNFTPALNNLAVDSFGNGDLAGTERYLRRILQVDPEESFSTIWLAFLTALLGRADEGMRIIERLRARAKDVFYITVCHVQTSWDRLRRGDLAGADRALTEGLAAGGDATNLRAFRCTLSLREGRLDEARAVVLEMQDTPGLGAGVLMALAATAIRLGEPERAVRYMSRKVIESLAPVLVRLDSELHSLAAHPAFAPRKLDRTLIWPLESPMIDPARFALFREVKIQSGIPDASRVSSEVSSAKSA